MVLCGEPRWELWLALPLAQRGPQHSPLPTPRPRPSSTPFLILFPEQM